MPIKPLTANALRKGISRWKSPEFNFPRDFHDSFYREMAQTNASMLSPKGDKACWWDDTLDHLVGWKAHRPKSRKYLTRRARPRLDAIKRAAKKLQSARFTDISDNNASWKLCAPLFDKAAEIKDVPSPVFPAKMCHFIFPRIFPVADKAAVGGVSDYPAYWEHVQGCWQKTPRKVRRQLKDILCREISKSGTNPIQGYPFVCKITELCIIGGHPRK